MIVKNGEIIAIGPVEHDDTLSGTGILMSGGRLGLAKDYATKDWVKDQHYLTSASVDVTKEWIEENYYNRPMIDDMLDDTTSAIKDWAEDTFQPTGDYATRDELSDAIDSLSAEVDEQFKDLSDAIAEEFVSTSAWVEEKIANLGGFEIVDGNDHGPFLPVEEAKINIIYLVKISEGKPDNYAEWIVTGSEGNKVWTCIGETTMDLSDYAKTEYVDEKDSALSAWANDTFATKQDVKDKFDELDGKVDSLSATVDDLIDDVNKEFENTSAWANDTFATKVDTYTKEEVDEKLKDLGGFEIVDGTEAGPSMPASAANPKMIYLVKDKTAQYKDNYFEWIVDQSTEPETWACIGETTLELSGYATKEYVEDTASALLDVMVEQFSATSSWAEDTFVSHDEARDWDIDEYSAGSGISISGHVISLSAEETELSAGDGINIDSVGNVTTIALTPDQLDIIGTNGIAVWAAEADNYLYIGLEDDALSDYYTKDETSGAKELSAAFETKQDELTFGYDGDAISSINSIPLAGQKLEAGTDLVIDDKIIKVNTDGTVANSADMSFVAGSGTYASGVGAAAFGIDTSAKGTATHAEGYYTSATNDYAHAQGQYTIASGVNSFAVGKYNTYTGADSLFVIGNGTSNSNRSDVFKVDSTGNTWYMNNGTLTKLEDMEVIGESGVYVSADNSNIYIGLSGSIGADLTAGTDLKIVGDVISVNTNGTIANSADMPFVAGSATYASGSGTFAAGVYTKAIGDQGAAAFGYGTSAINYAAFAEGYMTIASGGHAEGDSTSALGYDSHAEGWKTYTLIDDAHAEGSKTSALGNAAHSEGECTIASADNSHAEGRETYAVGEASHAEGSLTIASGEFSHAEGLSTSAIGECSHSQGFNTIAASDYMSVIGICNKTSADDALFVIGNGEQQGATSIRSDAFIVYSSGMVSAAGDVYANGVKLGPGGGSSLTAGTDLKIENDIISVNTDGTVANSADMSFVAGSGTYASGVGAAAFGINTSAIDDGSFAVGSQSIASGRYSYAEGYNTTAGGSYVHAEGEATYAIAWASHAEGYLTSATAPETHAEGERTLAAAPAAHAEGVSSFATAPAAHAEGQSTSAVNQFTHAEGLSTLATQNGAHAEGDETSALGYYTHTEGGYTLATEYNAHAEGERTSALAQNAHAEGQWTEASGYASHAEGIGTSAVGFVSHAQGRYTLASGDNSFAAGKYNTFENASALFVIGNGTDDNNRSDAFMVYPDGLASATVLATSGIPDIEAAISDQAEVSGVDGIYISAAQDGTVLFGISAEYATEDEFSAYYTKIESDNRYVQISTTNDWDITDYSGASGIQVSGHVISLSAEQSDVYGENGISIEKRDNDIYIGISALPESAVSGYVTKAEFDEVQAELTSANDKISELESIISAYSARWVLLQE